MSFVVLITSATATRLLATAVIIGLIYVLYIAILGPLHDIPGPWHTKFTIFGLKYKTLTGKRCFWVHELHLKYGPVVRISPNEVDVSDYDAFREIHRIGNGFLKSNWYTLFTPGIEDNIFAMTDTHKHAAPRRLLARPFSKSSLLEHFQPLVKDRAQLAVSKIKEDALTGNCDMFKWWTLMTTDVIAEVAFGERTSLLEAGTKTQYIDDLDKMIQASGIRAEGPVIYYLLRLAGSRLMAESDAIISRVRTYGLTAARRAKKAGLHPHNAINGMIQASDAKDSHLTDSTLGSQASALIIAGSGTTAVTLTYAVWAILSRPSMRSRLEAELGHLDDDYDDLALEKLPYLNAVVDETLRLYGAAPGALPRIVPSKGLRVQDFFIQPQTTVTTQAYSMHRDPQYFRDPETYNPDRFLPDGLSTMQKHVFTPFGSGSRTCLGMHLAYIELRHGIAEFFRRCQDLVLSGLTTPESMEMENFFLIGPKSKCCILTSRAPSNPKEQAL